MPEYEQRSGFRCGGGNPCPGGPVSNHKLKLNARHGGLTRSQRSTDGVGMWWELRSAGVIRDRERVVVVRWQENCIGWQEWGCRRRTRVQRWMVARTILGHRCGQRLLEAAGHSFALMERREARVLTRWVWGGGNKSTVE